MEAQSQLDQIHFVIQSVNVDSNGMAGLVALVFRLANRHSAHHFLLPL